MQIMKKAAPAVQMDGVIFAPNLPVEVDDILGAKLAKLEGFEEVKPKRARKAKADGENAG